MSLPFIIIADRGRLKMFAVEKAASRLRFNSLADTQMLESRLKGSEKYTDRPGTMDNPGDGLKAGSGLEQLGVGLEENKRIFERLGQNITALLQEHGVENWMFAAPAGENKAILEHVDAKFRSRLTKNITSDLVNAKLDTLAGHFSLTLNGAEK